MSVPVIEWGSGTYRGYDPLSHRVIVNESLDSVFAELGRPKVVGLALGRRVALVKKVTLPDTGREQLVQIVALQVDQLFPVGSGELATDYIVTGKVGRELSCVAVAVRTEVLRQAQAALKLLGAKIAWISPTSLAAPLAAAEAGESQAVVVEDTGSGIGFDVVQDGALSYSRVSVEPESPEAMEHELERTRATVRAESASFVAIGGLRSDLAKSMLRASSLEYLAKAPPRLELDVPEVKLARTAKAVEQHRRYAFYLAVLAGLVGLGVVWDRIDAQKKVDDQVAVITKQTSKAKTLSDVAASRYTGLQVGVKALQQGFQPAQFTSDVLSTLADATTKEVWLTSVNYERGKELEVRGTATTEAAVSTYVTALTTNPRFRNVVLVTDTNSKIDDTPVYQFSLTAHVVGNYPIVDKEKKVVTLGHNVQTYNLACGVAVLVTFGFGAYDLIAPKPSAAAPMRKATQDGNTMTVKARGNTKLLADAQKTQDAYTWKLQEDKVAPQVLSTLSDLAKTKNVSLSNFRPGKIQKSGNLDVLSFSLNVAGPYPQVQEFIHAVEDPAKLLAVEAAQVTEGDGASDSTVCNLNLYAMVAAAPAAPAPTTSPAGTSAPKS